MCNIRQTLAISTALVALIGIAASPAQGQTAGPYVPPVKQPAPPPVKKPAPKPPVKQKPVPAPPADSRQCTKKRANQAMAWDADTFYTVRRGKPWKCDWSSDGCAFNDGKMSLRPIFHRACVQHDFGYRNYGHGLSLGRNEATRERIDDHEYVEFVRACENAFSVLDVFGLDGCMAEALAAYAAVRNLGRDAFYNG